MPPGLIKKAKIKIKEKKITDNSDIRICIYLIAFVKGHAILGNFSTDRMVIELTKISK